MTKNVRWTSIVCLLLLLCTSAGQARATTNRSNVELQFGGKSLEPTGWIRAEGSMSGSEVDVESNLDVTSEEDFTIGLRTQSRGIQGLRASYSNFVFEGKNNLDENITYNDQTFLMNNTVESELDFKFYSLDLEYRLTEPTRQDFFNFVFGGRYIDYQGDLESSSRTASSSFETGIPVLGFTARKYLAPGVFLQGRWQGMEATLDDNELQYLDGEVSFGVNPFGKLWLVGSYSDFRIDGTNNDDHFDLKFTGPGARILVYF